MTINKKSVSNDFGGTLTEGEYAYFIMGIVTDDASQICFTVTTCLIETINSSFSISCVYFDPVDKKVKRKTLSHKDLSHDPKLIVEKQLKFLNQIIKGADTSLHNLNNYLEISQQSKDSIPVIQSENEEI